MTNVLTGELTFTSLKQLDLSVCTKEKIREYFLNSYSLYESLFASLTNDSAFYEYPDRLRLPLIFYYAHTAVVYVNKLMLAGLLKERVNLKFESLFETGVDEMSWDDTVNYRMGGGQFVWPEVAETVEYRRKVKNLVLQLITDTHLTLPINMKNEWWALLMGMEHERIHLETSSVLIRQLPINLVRKPIGWTYAAMKTDNVISKNPFLMMEGKEVNYGKPRDFPSYGWDNEYGEAHCYVPKFEASKYLITNGQFAEFVADKGYQRQELWSEKGWKWKNFRGVKHPTFWVCTKDCKSGCGGTIGSYSHCQPTENQELNGNTSSYSSFHYRAMFDVIALPKDWPVEVNYHEAKAYCAWLGSEYRLPTESEMVLMRGTKTDPSKGVLCDIIHSDKPDANINMKYGSPTPVNLFPPTEAGFHDIYGNVWQWIEDHFNGLEGFNTHWLYDDFSSPCFDGYHNMIMGGSWISTGNEASCFARFAFRRHFFQHLGFRVVRAFGKIPVRLLDSVIRKKDNMKQEEFHDNNELSKQTVASTNSQYRYDDNLNLVKLFETEFNIRDSLPAIAIRKGLNFGHMMSIQMESALVIGSSSGKAAFELSTSFARVLGIDFSSRLISIANKLKHEGRVTFPQNNDTNREFTIDTAWQTENVTFKQLTWLSLEIGAHDFVLLMFLNRVQNYRAWLCRVWELLKETSVLIIVSSGCDWNADVLQPLLEPRLRLISEEVCDYETSECTAIGIVSAWVLN